MEYRRLGQSGLKVSALSFGSWVTFGTAVDKNLAVDLMAAAYDAGINFFDNAEVYERGESERLMGGALKTLNWSRDSYCVSSKVFWGGDKPTQRGLSRKHIHDACHAALKRLQVEYLDLFFCHRPDIDAVLISFFGRKYGNFTFQKFLKQGYRSSVFIFNALGSVYNWPAYYEKRRICKN